MKYRIFGKTGFKTFSGIDYELGLEVVEELKKIKPKNMTMPQFALKWILMNKNVKAQEFGSLDEQTLIDVDKIYDKYMKKEVHHLW